MDPQRDAAQRQPGDRLRPRAAVGRRDARRRGTGRRRDGRRSTRRDGAGRARSTGTPEATTLPSRSTVTRSASSRTSSSTWLTNSTPPPSAGDAVHLAEQGVDLAAAQRGGRLVEHEQAGLGGIPVLEGTHDRHRRPLGRRQCGDGLADVRSESERQQQLLGAGDLAAPADPAAARRLVAAARGRGCRPSTATARVRGPGGRCGSAAARPGRATTGRRARRRSCTSAPWSART